MNLRITTPSNRFNNSNGRRLGNEHKRITNNDGRRVDHQSHDRLENSDQIIVSFGAPRTTTMNVDEYDHEDGNDLIEK